MATRKLTQDEVDFIMKRREGELEQGVRDQFEKDMNDDERAAIDQRRQELQAAGLQRRVSAMHNAAADWRKGQRDREAAEREHWDDLYRQNHGGFSKAEMQAFGPDGSIAQRKNMMRAMELRAAREHEAGMQGKEMETRLKVAEQNRLGMENQGVGAATVRANADKDILGDKEKQRQHELAMLGQTQTFQGAQNDAERQNKLAIAKTQGQSAVDAARAQAEARAADIAAKNDIEREKIAARKEIAAMRENGKLTQAGMARLSKTYGGLVAAGYSPARIRALLKEEGWTDEELNAAQGRQQ